MINKLLSYLLAVVVSYLLAVLAVSQFNIASVTELGYTVSFAERGSTFAHDLVGMTNSYLPLIAIALLLAFLFTGLILQRMISGSVWLYALAGFVGILALHIILNTVFGIHAVAPTRSTAGLISQAMAGAVGGYLYFHQMMKRKAGEA